MKVLQNSSFFFYSALFLVKGSADILVLSILNHSLDSVIEASLPFVFNIYCLNRFMCEERNVD